MRAALDLFAHRGFDEVTVEDIAASCERAPRTFFRHFASKEEVLFADAEDKRTHLLAVLTAQPPDLFPFDALRAAMLGVSADYEDQREVLLLLNQIINATPSLRSRAVEHQHRWEADVVDQLRTSPWAGQLDELDLHLLVAGTTTALRVAIELWIAEGAKGSLQPVVAAALDRMAGGLMNLGDVDSLQNPTASHGG